MKFLNGGVGSYCRWSCRTAPRLIMTTSCRVSTRWPEIRADQTETAGEAAPVGQMRPVGWRHVADPEELRTIRKLESFLCGPGDWLATPSATAHPRNERLAPVSPAPAWRAARIEFEARSRSLDDLGDRGGARALRASGLRSRLTA